MRNLKDERKSENAPILYSEEFNKLPKEEKKRIVIEEFIKCHNDIKYFIENYAYVRHPKAGIIKFKPFDFQWEIINTISVALKKGRSEETYKELLEFKPSFDYKKFIEFAEQNIEFYKKIPKELQEQYTVWINNPLWKTTPDYIILKSRQTGISTVFQIITEWYVNFHPNKVVLVVSQRDKEAIKFLHDIKVYWGLLPNPLKAKKLKDNDHELHISITGEKKDVSIVQSLAPSPDAGRSYSPNLIILDEFAMYKKAEELWTAISMSVSAGGIIVIISTPKGIGNMFHKLWTEAVREVRNTISLFSGEENITIDKLKEKEVYTLSTLKPFVVHWTQLPEEEFKRRGFKDALDWYEFMKSKLIMEGGIKKVAQELDLAFLGSGDTAIPPNIIEYLKNNRCIEDLIKEYYTIEVNTFSDTLKRLSEMEVLSVDVNRIESIIEQIKNEVSNVIIYRKPETDKEYMIGVDVAEGLGKDYSVFYVMQVPKDTDEVPKLCAYYSSNKISPRKFAYLIWYVAKLYNNAYLNIERNSVGVSVIEILEEIYSRAKILNTYNPNKKDIDKFSKNEKGWKETSTTRNYLIENFIDFVINYYEVIEVNKNLVDELYTFIDTGKRYEHMEGFHDDNIFSYALTIIGIKILPKYLQFLQYKNVEELSEITEIPPDLAITSSLIKDDYLIETSNNNSDLLFRKVLSVINNDKNYNNEDIEILNYNEDLKRYLVSKLEEYNINDEYLIKNKLTKLNRNVVSYPNDNNNNTNNNDNNYNNNKDYHSRHKFISRVIEMEEDDFFVF